MKPRKCAVASLILAVVGVMQAQPSQAQPNSPSFSSTAVTASAAADRAAGLPDPEVAGAMKAASQGDTRKLQQLLASAKAPQMRVAVQEWVTSHPTPAPQIEHAKAVGKGAIPLTGEYDYYCTGYNGQTLGWNGAPFHACHGYLDSYISGSHAGHYVPDAYDPGPQMSVACSHAYAGAAFFSLGLLSGGSLDALGTVVAIGGGGWSVEEMWISCGRTS